MEETGRYVDNPQSNRDVDDVQRWCKALGITPSQFFRMPEEELKLRLNNLKGQLRLRVAKNMIALQKEKLDKMEKMHNYIDYNLQQRNRGNATTHLAPTDNRKEQWHTRVMPPPPLPRARAGGGTGKWYDCCFRGGNESGCSPPRAIQGAPGGENTLYAGFQPNAGRQSTPLPTRASACAARGGDGTLYGGFQPNACTQSTPLPKRASIGGQNCNRTAYTSFRPAAASQSTPRKTWGPTRGGDFDGTAYGKFQPCGATQSTPRKSLGAPKPGCIPTIKHGSLLTQRRSEDSVQVSDFEIYVEDSPRGNVTNISSLSFMAGLPKTSTRCAPRNTPSPPPRRPNPCPAPVPPRNYARGGNEHMGCTRF